MGEEFVLGESPKSDEEYTLIPEDSVLECEVLKVEKKTQAYKDDDGNPVVRVEFEFRVVDDGEFKNRRLWGNTSTLFTTHEDCKLNNWVRAILGLTEIGTGFRFDTGDLITQRVRVVVGQRSYTKKDGEEKTVNTVGDLIFSRENQTKVDAEEVAKIEAEKAAELAQSNQTAPAPLPAQELTTAGVASSLGATEDFGEEPF